jgi:hypothetical protein
MLDLFYDQIFLIKFENFSIVVNLQNFKMIFYLILENKN